MEIQELYRFKKVMYNIGSHVSFNQTQYAHFEYAQVWMRSESYRENRISFLGNYSFCYTH